MGIQEIATATGLSKSTVSRALRGMSSVAGPTIDEVRRVADELGYVPSQVASGLATGRQRAVGVVLPVIERWFYVRALAGVDAALRAAGYDLVLYNLGGGREDDGQRAFRRSMLRQRVDALVLMSLALDETERQELHLTDHPMVVVGGPAPGIRNVGVDDHAVAETATRSLLELGHRRIAYVGGKDEDGQNVAVPYLRRDGFVDTLRAAGLGVSDDWLLDGGFSFAGGVRAGTRLFGSGSGSGSRSAGPSSAVADRPTAVFCASDEMALGVLLAAARAGLSVPEDVSVMGIDGHEYGEVAGLTTMAQDPRAQGVVAAGVVLGELDGIASPAVLPAAEARLLRRGSTGPVRG